VAWRRYVHLTYELLKFAYAVAYLYSSSRFFSPLLHATGQRLVRVDRKEMIANMRCASDCSLRWILLLFLSVELISVFHLHVMLCR
jgi:Pex2/Pex12-like protein